MEGKDEKFKSLETIVEELKKNNPEELNFNLDEGYTLNINGKEFKVDVLFIKDQLEKGDDSKPDIEGAKILLKAKDSDKYVVIGEIRDGEILLTTDGMKEVDDNELLKSNNEISLEKKERTKDDKEIVDEEELDLEEEDKGKEEDEQNNLGEQNKNNRDLVYLNAKVFKVLMPSAKQYGAIAIDKTTNEICGRNRDTGEMEPIKGLNNVGQNRANMTICGMENEGHSDLQAKAMWQIGSQDSGFAIVTDGKEKGNIDIKYVVREHGTGANTGFKNYINLPLLESNGKRRNRNLSS